MDHCIGIDISKATLQVYIPRGTQELEFVNASDGYTKLYAKLKKLYRKELEQLIFIYEPTGSYSTPLEHFCAKQKIHCFRVEPVQSASFAKTIKNRSKSDRIDAKMLHRMHILMKPGDIRIPVVDTKASQIKSLIKYYQSLSKEHTQYSNYLEASQFNREDELVLKSVKAKLQKLKKEQAALLAKIVTLIRSDAKLSQAFSNITSIKGIGELTGVILLYQFMRYPDASRQSITALCGLDPIIKESGTSLQKRARISKKGLTMLRGMLFMPTLCAIMYNPEMKLRYEQLTARGKHATLAQIAIMRKLVLLAFSLYKNNQQYDPEHYLKFIRSEKNKKVVS